MADFMIRFLMCNIFISGIIGILLIAKHLLKNTLSSRMQYNMWLFLLGLLVVPFLPFRPIGLSHIMSLLKNLRILQNPDTKTILIEAINANSNNTANWTNDFAISVSSNSSSLIGSVLCGIWISGILAMIILVLKSKSRLTAVKKSALPLQNSEVCRLYHNCLMEMKIKKEIPVYSTVFLKSPILVGYWKPCIYLPIHLISDYRAADMRYMLLHELQHYKHGDALGNYLMNLAGIIYWFNPFVWYALKEMRNDREVACDTSVLEMLDEDDYEDYGNTLINFAEKVSLTPFPFATGISGSMRQLKKRILNIATYAKPTLSKRLRGFISFLLTAILLIGLAPTLSTYAADDSHYQWDFSNADISYVDYTTYFEEYAGSFVLYDLENDTWRIHNKEHATLRVSPDSTYKIYDALFGLEEGIITPDDSFIDWNHEIYPFTEWNTDQTLQSAMQASVNWYFQTIDEQMEFDSIHHYIQKIGYGNENCNSDLSSYWMESSLKISPIEQVELLTKLYNNSFGFAPENINTVKDSVRLFSSEKGTFYGKTGTGRVNGQDVNGWFIGYIENTDNTYFFATNIRSDDNATGSNATEITMSILSDLNIRN